MTFTHGSLFSGIGGFDLGFEREGIRTAWICEADKYAQSTLRRHWPDVPLYDDVLTMRGDQVEPVDVISFGSPCQDISSAGPRTGLYGSRSILFFEAIRIIREMRKATDGRYPQFAVWENSARAISSRDGKDFGAALDSLAISGALDIGWRILDAQYAGIPQQRRRIIVVADFRGTRASFVLHLEDSSGGYRRASRPARSEVVAALTRHSNNGPDDNAAQAGHLIVANTLTARYYKGVNTTMDDGAMVLTPDVGVRTLMPVECERLQGFPDGHTDHLSDKQRYRTLGNAVAVPIAQKIAAGIATALA